jgi:16S rRNA (cytosine967-C5)-methyltransferase
MNPVTPALSHSLLAAASSVAAVESGQSLTEALADVPPDLRPAAQALAFYAMRHWGMAKALRRTLVEREPPSATMYALIGLSLLLLDASIRAQDETPEQGTPIYGAHTLVDQAVQATQWHRSTASFKGLVNAVLRRFQRERLEVMTKVAEDLEATWNHPRWWIEHLQQSYPQDWEALLVAANTHPPLTLRVNARATTREAVLQAFAEQGIEAIEFGAAGLVLKVPRPITSLPGYAQGWWSVQDAGAQLAAPMMDVSDGMQVLDACAAPGGKTAHLLELAKVDLTALDIDATRLERVHQNLKRLGLMRRGIRLVADSAIKTHVWWDGKPFDAVLADLPCTASGIVSRHPDIRWLRRAQDVQQTAKLAREILDSLWSVVAPGGKLLLVTCSIFPEEGEMQAQAFGARHAQAERLSAPGQLLPHLPDAAHPAGYDGFFYALFTRKA